MIVFQSPGHEQSYRNACRALACARREAYRAASAMTTADLYASVRRYRAEVPGPVTGEALAQLRMVSTVIAHRGRPLANRSALRRTRKGR
jgi:hypothetical protein